MSWTTAASLICRNQLCHFQVTTASDVTASMSPCDVIRTAAAEAALASYSASPEATPTMNLGDKVMRVPWMIKSIIESAQFTVSQHNVVGWWF